MNTDNELTQPIGGQAAVEDAKPKELIESPSNGQVIDHLAQYKNPTSRFGRKPNGPIGS